MFFSNIGTDLSGVKQPCQFLLLITRLHFVISCHLTKLFTCFSFFVLNYFYFSNKDSQSQGVPKFPHWGMLKFKIGCMESVVLHNFYEIVCKGEKAFYILPNLLCLIQRKKIF